MLFNHSHKYVTQNIFIIINTSNDPIFITIEFQYCAQNVNIFSKKFAIFQELGIVYSKTRQANRLKKIQS